MYNFHNIRLVTQILLHHRSMGVEIFYYTHGVRSGSLMLNVV